MRERKSREEYLRERGERRQRAFARELKTATMWDEVRFFSVVVHKWDESFELFVLNHEHTLTKKLKLMSECNKFNINYMINTLHTYIGISVNKSSKTNYKI